MSPPVHQLEILRLASSYHSSDYNRARFGTHGSPVKYLPLSLNLPDKFRVLRARQLCSAERQSWWPAVQESSLEHDLMCALSSSLPVVCDHPLRMTIKTSSSHPINISYIIPPELKAIIASHALLAPTGAPTILEIPNKFTLFHFSPRPDFIHPEQLSPSSIFQTRTDLANAITAAIASGIRSHDDCSILPAPNINRPLTIGNLFLSSCPGKKVRLDGPVNGRSGICRDLLVDIARMAHLGVSCIICCLDDDELEFLGAPWQEYEQCAKQIGIDVLRLPTPEGFPPATSASHLDGYLVDLINRYSLRGHSILVHCRGGVGRAGVFACCWMIRLGLCGWIEEVEHHPDSTANKVDGDAIKKVTRKNDRRKEQYPSTIDFVKSVIALVRRRRSMKAIETYEQVEFLVDYVDHLRNFLKGIPLTKFDGLLDCKLHNTLIELTTQVI